jgi:hypothetical protein
MPIIQTRCGTSDDNLMFNIGDNVILEYCKTLYPIVTWEIIGVYGFTNTFYLLKDNCGRLYWWVTENNLIKC